jgi:hypothetical protein
MGHMKYRFAMVCLCAGFAALGMAQPAAKPAPVAGKKYVAPRTADGHPDLQGIWSNATITPLERPADLAGKATLTAKEAADYEKARAVTDNRDRRDGGAEADVGRAYNEFWYDRGSKVIETRRTSLVVDPPDGRIPALTPEAQKRMAAQAARRNRPPEGPEDRTLSERCLNWATAGPPMMPSAYNNNYQIVQTPHAIVISNEMVHDVRVIPMDGRPHVDKSIRQWMGDSRGHWEGDTLVVDTTNFSDKTGFRGASANMHLTERFTRVAPDVLMYEFTVDDASAFARPWTVQIPSEKIEGQIYEYACHEGNYGMVGMLGGAREAEKKAGK